MKRFWKNSVSVLLGISIILATACAPAATPQAAITQTPSTAGTPAPVITPGGPPIFTPSTAVTPAPVITPSTAVRPPPVITGGGQDVRYGGQGGAPPATPTTPAEAVAPLVSLTIPLNLAAGVGINSAMSIAFSEAMDPLTINADTFTVKQGATPVAGTVTYTGVTATFTPSSSLAPNTEYTVAITTGAKDLAGNALARPFTWKWTTAATLDTTAPIVINTINLNGATGVSVNVKAGAFFSEPMNPLTITADTFTLMRGTTPVAGNVSYIGIAATFTPNAALAPNTEYTATITTGAKDLAGNALASPYIWKWTTGANPDNTAPLVNSTVPANAATGVNINFPPITATFNEAIDPLTLTTATFTLKQGSTLIPGMVTVSFGTRANFLLADALAYSTVYTVTITTGAKDLAGNALAADRVWTFTTGAPGVSPLPGGGGGPILAANPTAPLGTGGPLAGTVLGEASRFVIVGHAAITANPGGATVVSNGDIGLINHARSVYAGFTAGATPGSFTQLTNGLSYAWDDLAPFTYPAPYASTLAFLVQVESDLGYAYAYLNGVNPTAPTNTLASTELGSKTFTRGVYKTGASATISTGALHLDAQGDPNSVFIFQIAGDLTTSSPGLEIFLDNGAQAKNVYFVTGGQTVIGAGMKFRGTVFAGSQITVASGALLTGRFFAMTAGVTTISNTITRAP